MRKAFLILLMLIACVVARETYPWSNSYWSYSNPNIFHIQGIEIWNFYKFQLSLDSLELNEISSIDDLKVRDLLESAKYHYAKSKDSYSNCNSILGSIQTPTLDLTLKTADLISLELSKGAFSECGKYPEHWKSTMEYSSKALDSSIKKLDAQFKKTSESKDALNYAGICTNKCNQFAEDYYLIKNYSEFFNSELYSPLPNLLGYKEALVLAEEKVTEDLANAEAEFSSSLSDSVELYYQLEASTKQKEQTVSEAYKKLQEQQVGLIETTPPLGAVIVNFEGRKISERFYEAGILLNSANLNYSSAKNTFTSKKKNYLNNSLTGMGQTYSQYGFLTSEVQVLAEDSEDAVEQAKLEAEEEIEKFESAHLGKVLNPKSKARYLEAKKSLEQGDFSATLGAKYVAYAKAATYARNAFSLADSSALYANSTLEFALLGELIKSAKKDGLKVTEEEEELKLLKDVDEQWALEEMERLEESVISKAKITYSNIEAERSEVLELIEISPDLFYEIDEFEVHFKNGKLDFKSAIGNLKRMQDAYLYTKKEAEKEIDRYVSGKISVSLLDPTPSVFLNEVITHELLFSVKNPTKYEGKSIRVKLHPVENGYATSSERFSLDPLTMELQIEKLEPYELIIGSAEKKIVPAEIIKSEIKANGDPDGTALLSETTEFEAERDLYLEHESKATFFRKGAHTLKSEKLIYDAFSLSFSNAIAKKVGTDYEVEYDISIEPKLNMEATELLIPEEGNSFTVFSYSGEKVLKKQTLSNGYYLIQLGGLKENKTAVLKATYRISNVSDYAGEPVTNATAQEVKKITEGKIETTEQTFLTNKEKLERDALLQIFSDEHQEIGASLNGSSAGSLSEILSSRKEKLNETLENLPKTKESIEQLKDLDKDWLQKTLNQYKKDSFSEYKKLKDLAGTLDVNYTVFDDVDSLYNKFLGSGEVEDAVQLSSKLELLKNQLDTAKKEKEATYSEYSEELNSLKNSMNEALKPYLRYYSSAKGSDFEYLFSFSPSELTKELNSLEELIKKRSKTELILTELDSLRLKLEKMQAIPAFLKNESFAKLDAVKKIYTLRKNSLAKPLQEKILQGLEKAESQIQNEDYIGSLKSSAAVLKLMNATSLETEDYSIPLLGLTALLLLGITAIYVIRRGKRKKDGKELIKLKSLAD